MNYKDLITIEPDKRSGKPCIRGTRMGGQDVREYFAVWATEAEFLVEFLDSSAEDICADILLY